MNSIAERIVGVIATRHGEAESISARQIARRIGWPLSREREVRRIIASVWGRGDAGPWLLGTRSGGGYWRVTQFEEAASTARWLRALADRARARAEAYAAHCRRFGLHIGGGGQRSDAIAKLIERQRVERLSDREVAKRFGLSASTWCRVRSGRYRGSLAAISSKIESSLTPPISTS
jgi:hypothetical protein